MEALLRKLNDENVQLRQLVSSAEHGWREALLIVSTLKGAAAHHHRNMLQRPDENTATLEGVMRLKALENEVGLYQRRFNHYMRKEEDFYSRLMDKLNGMRHVLFLPPIAGLDVRVDENCAGNLTSGKGTFDAGNIDFFQSRCLEEMESLIETVGKMIKSGAADGVGGDKRAEASLRESLSSEKNQNMGNGAIYRGDGEADSAGAVAILSEEPPPPSSAIDRYSVDNMDDIIDDCSEAEYEGEVHPELEAKPGHEHDEELETEQDPEPHYEDSFHNALDKAEEEGTCIPEDLPNGAYGNEIIYQGPLPPPPPPPPRRRPVPAVPVDLDETMSEDGIPRMDTTLDVSKELEENKQVGYNSDEVLGSTTVTSSMEGDKTEHTTNICDPTSEVVRPKPKAKGKTAGSTISRAPISKVTTKMVGKSTAKTVTKTVTKITAAKKGATKSMSSSTSGTNKSKTVAGGAAVAKRSTGSSTKAKKVGSLKQNQLTNSKAGTAPLSSSKKSATVATTAKRTSSAASGGVPLRKPGIPKATKRK